MNHIDPPDPTFLPATPLLDREWDRLLNLMRKGELIPVVGPELMCVPCGSQPSARLYDLWGKALAEQRGIEAPTGDEETPLLYRIANRLSVNPDIPLGDLEYDINDVVCNSAWPVPVSLLQLAEISDFPLYLTTTIDHLLETALLRVRGEEYPPHVIAFNCGGRTVDTDLPGGFIPSQRPTIFYFFGRTCTDREGFAATEDALIEFSWALLDRNYAPINLYDFLRNKTLLLLGCNFPDWLDRFFIHALMRNPDAGIVVMYVSEYRMAGLYDFLRRKKEKARPPVIQSPVAFVAELHRRWRKSQGYRPQPGTSKPGAVFISYAREDLKFAKAIKAQLEAAYIDTWMDESGLEPGEEFKPVIRENIEKASFFLALISKSLDLEGTDRPGRFVLREWKWAEETAQERNTAHGYLQAVVIDDTLPNAPFIDRPFHNLTEKNCTFLKDGALPPHFIDFVKQGIRRFRTTGGAP